jgi:Flp pilus assembly pilin Flp
LETLRHKTQLNVALAAVVNQSGSGCILHSCAWELLWGIIVNTSLSTRLKAFWCDVEGAQAVEYVVIAAALTTAIIPGFYYVSSAVADQLTFITSFVMGM